MPRKPRDLDEELRAVRDGARRSRSDAEEESDPPARDSKVQVHLYQQPSRRTEYPREHGLRAILNNEWVKLFAAFVLGAGGSEAHKVVRGGQDADEGKVARAEKIEKLEKRQETARQRVDELEKEAQRTRAQLYSLGRFTYSVMKKQGVGVYLKEGAVAPADMEFQPSPLKPSAAPAVQPAESFPLPDRP